MKTLHYILLFTLTLFCADIYAQEGTLDLAFGNDGKVLFKFGTPDYYAYDAVIQSDGKILIVGCITYSGNNNDVLVMRLNSDGSIDNSFQSIGFAKYEITSIGFECAKSVKIVGNHIILAGYSGNKAFIMKLNMDGSVDTSFGAENSGFIVIEFLYSIHDFITIPLINTYEIVVAGTYFDGHKYGPGLARFTENGDVVSSFGTDGKAFISGDLGKGTFTGITADLNTIYAFGLINFGGTPNDDAFVAKFDMAGSIKKSFYIDGPIEGRRNNIISFHLYSTGELILCGNYAADSGNGAYLCKVNGNGILNGTFGDSGYRFTTNTETLNSLIVQSNGKVLLGGNSKLSGTDDFNLIRLNSDGTDDLTFNEKGWILTDINGGNDFIEGMMLQSNEKLICIGNTTKGSDHSISVARYIVRKTSGNIDSEKGVFNLDIFPNPICNGKINLSYDLQNSGNVKISLHSLTGQSPIILKNGIKSEGYHKDQIVLPGNINSGVYILNIETEKHIINKKITVL